MSTDTNTAAALPSKRERKYLIALSMLVLLPGLGISAWSFYGYARSANAPILLAGSASAAIDGIGLFAAYFAARFTNRGQSARFPRLVTYLMIAASVYINWAHASSQRWSTGLHAFVSAPAVASAFAFEILMLELRVNERAKREQRRRSRMSAKVDADLWLHHPFAVWGARRWESRDRLAELFPGHRNTPSGTVLAREVSGASEFQPRTTKLKTAEASGSTVPEPASEVYPKTDVSADQPRNSGRTPRASSKRSGSGSKRASRSAPKRLDDVQLAAEAERLNAESWETDGRTVSLRKLMSELHIGQPRATALLDALTAVSEGVLDGASEDALEGVSGVRIPLSLGDQIRRPLAAVNGTTKY